MKRVDVLKEKLTFLMEYDKSNTKEIEKVKEQIEKSKKGKSARTKGSSYENTMRKRLQERFSDLDFSRTPQSGGFKKNSSNTVLRGDLNNLNEDYEFKLHLELKDHNKWSLPSWIKQAKSDCPKGRFPVVLFHQIRKLENGSSGKVIQEADDYVAMRLEDFLNIIDDSKIVIRKKVIKKKVGRINGKNK